VLIAIPLYSLIIRSLFRNIAKAKIGSGLQQASMATDYRIADR